MIDEHNRQKHTDFPCITCKKMFKKNVLKEHELACPKRLKQCRYCEMEMQECELKNHQSTCGSHTDACQYCQKTMLVKNIDNHLLNCEKNPERIDTKKGNIKKNNNDNFNNINNPNIIKENYDGLDNETIELLKKLQFEDDQKFAMEMYFTINL